MDKTNKENALATVSNSGVLFDLDILNNRGEALQLFTDLLKGRKQGITTPYEALMVYTRCRELQLPFASSIDHMAIIGGKICADIHIKTALALRAGRNLWWEKIKDYEPQYKYTDGTNEWISPHKPNKFIEVESLEDPVIKNFQYVWDEASVEAARKAGKTPFYNSAGVHNAPWDYVTEYKFYRVREDKDGVNRTLTAIGRFSVLEGHIAKLGYSKDGSGRDPISNWGKYERRMVDVRAWDNGFKEIAADISMGMPEIGEMAEVAGISYKFDPKEGNASVEFDYDENAGLTENAEATVIDDPIDAPIEDEDEVVDDPNQ